MIGDDQLALLMSEAQLQANILDWVGWLAKRPSAPHWLAYHTFDSRRSAPGFPDLTLARPGRLIFAELKRQKGSLSVPQQGWRDALLGGPGEWVLWRPSDWLDGSIQRVLEDG